MYKYRNLYPQLIQRRMDRDTGQIALSEALQKSSDSEALRYLKASMEALPEQYTAISIREANRVRDCLVKELAMLGIEVEFDYQGSTTNNTHIRAHSDVDLLAVTTRFHTVEPPLIPQIPYTGEPIQDLIQLRNATIAILSSRFHAANVKDDSPMCVPIEGGSLLRKVDVVFSNWYHNQTFHNTKQKQYLGIKVLDAAKKERVLNFPFLHNKRLQEKDEATSAMAKPLIRCLKNIIADNKHVDISSYNVAGLAYNLPDESYKSGFVLPEVTLLTNFLRHSRLWEQSITLRTLCLVPNGTRQLFSDLHTDGISVSELKKLNDCIEELLNEIQLDTSNALTSLHPFLNNIRK